MIDLDVLKAHLRSDEVKTDPDRDTVLPALEAAAVHFVEQETERHFGASMSITEWINGTGSRELWLNEEAATITSVDYRAEIGDTWTAILSGDSDGWELRGRKLLRKGGCVWDPSQEYRVVYDFGYTAGQEPAEIRQLVIDLVVMRWRQRGIEGHASGRYGDYSFTLSDLDRIPGAVAVIDRWRGQGVAAR